MKTLLKKNFQDIINSIQADFKQFKVLVQHFVIRLFNNDIMKFENQRREHMVVMLTLIAVFSGFVSFFILWPYLTARTGFTSETVWIEKTFYMTLSMAFTGIVSVINWNNMFLDKKDYVYISGLPVKTGIMFSAKFFSLMIFVGMISLAMNLIPVFTFTFLLGDIINVNPFYSTSVLTYGWVHLFSSFIANLFVFLAVACIQGFLVLIPNPKQFKKVSLVVQSLLLMGFISIFVWFPQMAYRLGDLKEQYAPFIFNFPPAWFVGFYEHLIGNFDFVLKKQFYIAAIAVTALMDIYLLIIPISFKRFSRQFSNDTVTPSSHGTRGRLKVLLNRVLLKDPVERAMFYFSLRTLNRSPKHKFQVSAAAALPITFTITQLVIISLGKGSLNRIQPLLVAIPFVLWFFIIAGFRISVLHPVTEKANWIFKMTEGSKPDQYLMGLKKVFYVFFLVPITLFLFLVYLYCWNFSIAVSHTLFSFACAFLTLEAAFLNYHKMPFVSSYVPGKARLREFWFLYLAGFALYIGGLTWLGLIFLEHPLYYILFLVALVDAFWLMKRHRKKKNRYFYFVYDEEPEPAMLSLGLD